MAIIASAKTFVPSPEGLHPAACVDAIDLGMVDTPFGRKHRCRIVFELEARMEDGRPFIVSKTYTLSLHEKSALHKDLRSWRGYPFSPEELKGFDVERLIGVSCKLLITHVERDGTVYGNVTAITKAEKGKEYRGSGQYQRGNGHANGVHQDAAEHDDFLDADNQPPF